MQNTAHFFTKNEDSIRVEDLERYAKGWLLDGGIRQLSSSTLAGRRIVIAKLLWFLKQQEFAVCGLMELRQFLAYISTGHEDAEGRWGNPQLKKRVRPSTPATYYTRLRTLFRFLVQEEAIVVSPMEKLRPPVARPDQVQPFTQAQITALLTTAKALWNYLKEEMRENEDPLFLSDGGTRAGEALTRSGLLQLIHRLGNAAKIEAARCSPHTFRHTFAVEFLRAGGNVFTLQQLLGHTSLHMTNRYVALAQADIENQHRQFSPVDRMKGRKGQ